MTGSLYVKNGIFQMSLNIYDEFGKRRQKSISTGLCVKGNKKKANQMLRETCLKYENANIKYSKDQDFSKWIESWLEFKSRDVSASTLEGYYLYYNSHIKPYFESKRLKLSKVQPRHIQAYVDMLVKNGRKDGKGGQSVNSVKKHLVVINGALKHAMQLELIPTNPTERIIMPKQTVKFKGAFYSIEQINCLLEKAKGTNMEVPIMLASYYGLRRSEVVGLQWKSVDFAHNTITIEHTVVHMSSVIEKDTTKNKSSHRVLPLDAEIKRILKKLRTKQYEEQLLFGNAYNANDYVCKWEDGRRVSPDYISYRFKKILAMYGLPHIRFHDLRHTCASLLLQNGVSLKETQDWLGHHDYAVTADIYGHLDFASKKAVSDKMKNLIKVL